MGCGCRQGFSRHPLTGMQVSIAAVMLRGTLHLITLLLFGQVIAPEEIVDPNVDEHSVMTYLSQFPKAKLKPGAPVRGKQLNPKKAFAYGPGMWGAPWSLEGIKTRIHKASP